jgi:hypothetical protein
VVIKYQMTKKHTKIFKPSASKSNKIDIFGLKINHLATLLGNGFRNIALNMHIQDQRPVSYEN